MRTLDEIRQRNKRKNMFFDGMEEKPIQLSQETIKVGRGFYENCVKPTVRRVLNKHLSNTEI